MPDLFDPLPLARGPTLRNRFVLAPLTNTQSHDDGTLSDDEFRWLTMRAAGGFSITMTCASHVQAVGRGFPGQLGIFSDTHVPGLARLAAEVKRHGSVAIAQLHHAGMRAPRDLNGAQPVCPSDDAETGARALTRPEVDQLRDDFVAAAVRAQRAGFDGVEIHGAHGYVLCQFLSAEYNRRTDDYGGPLENRARLLREVVAGIRARCRADFTVGVRLSPERFGMKLEEARIVAGELMAGGAIDFLDLSLWDVFKKPNEEAFGGRPLVSWFTDLGRGAARLGAAGKISSAADARRCLETGLDFVILGRAAILHHDFPRRVAADPDFAATRLPVSPDYLAREGLAPPFIRYMGNWPGFVAAA